MRTGARVTRIAPRRRKSPRQQTTLPPAGGRAIRGATPNRPAYPRRVARVFRQFFAVWLLAKLAAAIVLCAGLVAASQMATTNALRISEIAIVGNELVAAEDIAATIGVEGDNAFTIRGRRLERVLRADPAIESVSVRARLPDRVDVLVRERTPVVVWEAAGRTVLTDANGMVLRAGVREDLPVIHAPDSPEPDPGGRVDPDAVRMAQSLAPRLKAEGLAGGQLEYRASTGATIILPDSARVALGTPDDLEDKLAAYRAIRRYLDQSRTHAQFIDVRFLDRPYFR